MSLYLEHRTKLQALEKLKAELSQLEESQAFKQEKGFTEGLKKLMSDYDMTPNQVLSVLNIKNESEVSAKSSRRKSAPVTYTNPNSGEKVIAKTRANKRVKAWIAQYGRGVVEGWASRD
ncbi:hypothetical protein LCGC14_0328130 [marine sediment metagenome]|uniref:MvaT DNA-binding domain-containing protein n=1 Tax=marine sediment metagenome TaxID=412755 RepID=A0A0F9TMV4_9ZZZZ